MTKGQGVTIMPDTAKTAETPTEQDPRRRAVIERDSAFDDKFFYSVKTTGVYCRPSCAARLARPQHVQFHLTCDDAEQAGFRPCKRCKPNQPTLRQQYAAKITEICRIIESAEEIPSLGELAGKAGLSAYHLHRVFKAITGVTPRAYAIAHRAKRTREELVREGATVTDAIYESGFNSSGRFYENSNSVLGMTPTQYRAGGANTQIHFAVGECSLGSILVAKSDKGVCAISLGDDPNALVRDLQDRFPKAHLVGGDVGFEELIARVVGFVEAPSVGLDLPLDVRGTAFQQRVWQALRSIPVGATATYTEIAKRIGAPKSVRAVAAACAANALAVAIPCHRVVRSDGGLSGYRWGVERKRALQQREVAG
jgi:AraC family transcriptional regulator of adaptative response/methylated-DNA-[protein]-cysteine methyltransferase